MDRFSFETNPVADVAGDAAAQRGDPRDSLFLVAKLSTDGLPPEQVRVRNLSAGGLMAEYPAAIANGTKVEIELRGIGAINGRVAWATDGRIGVAFDHAIDPLRARKPVTPLRRR